jgi:hypothetical protein
MEVGFRVSGMPSLIQLISFLKEKKKEIAYGTDSGYCPQRQTSSGAGKFQSFKPALNN